MAGTEHAAHTAEVHAEAHPGWMSSFTAEERKKLMHEDLDAAQNTLTVLLTIVTFGVLLGILGAVLSAVYSFS